MKYNNNFLFPGGNTSKGFFSYYRENINHGEASYIYMIKGGPGVGKSTFMKSIANKAEEKGYTLTYYYCSSDPDSLDAIKINGPDIIFVDGTKPHIMDPEYPGCVDNIINLGNFFDVSELQKSKNDIIKLTDEISNLFSLSYKFLSALSPLYNALYDMYFKLSDKDKINSFIRSLKKEIIGEKYENSFKEKKAFLSAITPAGNINFLDKSVNSKTVYILESNIGDITPFILNEFKYELKRKGFYIETFYCPVDPENKLEHIYIPTLDVFIVTSNKYHSYCKDGIKTNISSFYSNINTETKNYCEDLIGSLEEKSVSIIRRAKATHDLLEDYYKNAMNYDKLNKFTDDFIKTLI